ncbi:hypothetical protein CNMCM6106_000940 [Aspergillus hiratsukae]|uniref:Uncharacterized protein n=1 Tax=Aspergillus hiratsukae TaxID=1194566 RepID=A0A8H6UMD6_9EURO|nr:hypothetical protein CNMCM6106_000940 [Aspergillus hiratsukae]
MLATLALTNHQRPNLNTLPRPRPLPRPRIPKRRMRHPLRNINPFLPRRHKTIRALQQQPLLILHAGEIHPPLVGIILDSHGLARPRAPDVDYAVACAFAQNALCLVGLDVETDAVFGCFTGLIDMRSINWLSRGSGVLFADGMIEDNDAVGAGDMLAQQLLDFWVVEALDVGVGVEG